MPLVALIITVIFFALLVSPASAQVALGETDLGVRCLLHRRAEHPPTEPEWLAPEEPLVPEPAPVPTPESIPPPMPVPTPEPTPAPALERVPVPVSEPAPDPPPRT